jgi:hypothetical protein
MILELAMKRVRILILVSVLAACGPKARIFETPDQVLPEVKQVIETRDRQAAKELLGEEADFFLNSGDEELDKFRSQKFVERFKQKSLLQRQEDGSYVVLVGKDNWPFPVPVIKKRSGWAFDSELGKEIVQNRTIGFNELSAIGVLERIYIAQKDFYNFDLDHDGIKNYSSKIVSSEGKQDGLFWPDQEGKDISPLSNLYALALSEGYSQRDTDAQIATPYKGYYFKTLPTEKGYWSVAVPAVWNNSGIMTLAINEEGKIYQKNLGRGSKIGDLESVLLDESWERIQ